MKWVLSTVLMFMICTLGMSQTPEGEIQVEMPDGGVEVIGVDAFGAKVKVRYTKSGERVYQERTVSNETTYAFFKEGVLVKHGYYFF